MITPEILQAAQFWELLKEDGKWHFEFSEERQVQTTETWTYSMSISTTELLELFAEHDCDPQAVFDTLKDEYEWHEDFDEKDDEQTRIISRDYNYELLDLGLENFMAAIRQQYYKKSEALNEQA